MEQNNQKKKKRIVIQVSKSLAKSKTEQKSSVRPMAKGPMRPIIPLRKVEPTEGENRSLNDDNKSVKVYKPNKVTDEYREMCIVSEETWNKMSDSEKTLEYQRVLSEYSKLDDERIKSWTDRWNILSEEEKLKEYKDTVYGPAMEFFLSTQTGISQTFMIGDWEMFSLDDCSEFEWYFAEQLEEDGYYDTDWADDVIATSGAPLNAAEIDAELNVMGYDSSDVDGMSLEERREYIDYLKNQE